MDILVRQQLSRASELLADAARGRPDTSKQPNFALAINQAYHRGVRRRASGGPDVDALDALGQQDDRTISANEVYIPFDTLATRAMATTTGGKGGYLTDVTIAPLAEALKPVSVPAAAGATIWTGLSSNVAIPKESETPEAYWLGDTPPADPDPVVGQVSLTPRTVIALLTISLQLLRQGSEDAIVQMLLAAIGRTLGAAVLVGRGGTQPLGVTNTPGISTTTGGSFTHAAACEMKRKISEASARDEGIAFVSTPLVRETLEQRARATGLGFIWDNDRVASRPAFATPDMSSATMVCGYWPSVVIGIFGAGATLALDRATYFNSASVRARLMFECDVAVLHPAAFTVASSIT